MKTKKQIIKDMQSIGFEEIDYLTFMNSKTMLDHSFSILLTIKTSKQNAKYIYFREKL
jgi:hypothetical protein